MTTACAAVIALSGAHASDGWTKLGTSWSDKSEQSIASLAPRLTTKGWSSQDSFDERGKPSSPKPNVKTWNRPKAGSGLRGLRALITLAESQRDGYDAIHHSATRLPKKRPSEMTIGEIFAWIDATPGQHHAIGFYQIIPSTLKSLVARAGISPQVKFSQATQDYLGDILIADAGFNAFVSGDLDASRFMDNLAKIWAGFPMANGRSAYHGKAGNRASVSRAFFEAEMARIFKPEIRARQVAKIKSRGAER